MKRPQTKATKTVRLTTRELAAIDRVPPYQKGDGVPLAEAVERVRERTKAWLNAHQTKTQRA